MCAIKIMLLTIFFLTVFVSNTHAELKEIDIICDEWPPYQIVKKDQVSGFSAEVVKIIFERMKVNIKSIKVYPWKRVITMMEKGKADALFSANYTKDRTQFALYPDEKLVHSPWVMWVRGEDEFKFESMDDLLGKKVGLVRGYSYTPALWNFVKHYNLFEEVATDEQNFKKLDAGRVDFIAAELGNGYYIMKELGINNVIPLTTNPIKSDGLYIIFNKKNVTPSFVGRFSDELKNFKQESLYNFIYEKYFK